MSLEPRRTGRYIAIILGLTLVGFLAACGDHHGSNGESSTPPGDQVTSPGSLSVQTTHGPVHGMRKKTTGRLADADEIPVREFLGIPYAAPPEGNLRWKPPQPPEDWNEPLEADGFGPFCAQTDAFHTPGKNEDCLYLNVYAPDDTGKHPVMVWIYGGGFVSGQSNVYDPTPFVRRGVVVVTLNYRLGTLGLLALPALTAESPSGHDSGNYSLLDQQAALRWVQDNIAHFGGDPGNVTLFGESAGGMSVLTQLISPGSKGLFQKAIVESGSYLQKLDTLAQAEVQGEQFAHKVGCSPADLKCLRNVPVEKVLQAQSGFASEPAPTAATATLPDNLLTAFQSGHFHRNVKLILGTNRNEMRLFTAQSYDAKGHPLTAQQYKNLEPEAVRDVYPLKDFDGSADLAFSAVGTDSTFACIGQRILEAVAGHGTKTYAYEFNDPDAPSVLGLFLPSEKLTFSLGAAHASELPFLFDFSALLNVSNSSLDKLQKQLANTMADYWVRFAKTGNPNPSSGSAPFWPSYESSDPVYMSLERPAPRKMTDFAEEHHCEFWDQRD